MTTYLYPDLQHESTDAVCAFTGAGWTQNLTDNSGRNTKKAATTVTTGDYVTISPTFEFTDAFLFVYANNDAGKIRVYVDGVPYNDYDCYLYNSNAATNPAYNTPVVQLSGLKRGTHVIKIECLGQKGPDSSGFKIGFNYVILFHPDYPVGMQIEKRVEFIGDSNSDNSSGFAYLHIPKLTEALRPGSGVTFRFQTRPGVGSDFARFAENSIKAHRASFVSVMLGTNDLPVPAQLNKTIDNIKLIVAACKKLGVPCQICTVPPREDVTAFYYIDLNEKIRQLCRDNDIPVIDWKPVFNDTPGHDGLFNSDGIHMSNPGHARLGKLAFDTMISRGHPFRKILFS